MTTKLRGLLANRFAIFWFVVFAAIMIAAPQRGPTKDLLGRCCIAVWCASGFTLAALHLFKPPAARIVLDALFTLRARLSLFGRERDAYAMSDTSVRALGIALIAITLLGLYDIFFR